MNDATYNGWTNYETWNVALHLDNDQGSQELMQEYAQECVDEALSDNESDIRAAATYSLSKRIEEFHDEMHEQTVTVSGVFCDLLSAALRAVDWHEIARHYVDDIELFSAGWNTPGYMPDSDPAIFTDADEALDYIKEQLVSVADVDGEQDTPAWSNADTMSIDTLKADAKGEFGATIHGFHYFVTKL